ncbi:hypothetical protein MMC16_007444 [Acarospora aff. strigata]|nr:hypothetical protein [Acarospora aff. strigata]
MFEIGADSKPAEKCYVTHGPLPAYIDPKQPPTKRRPFSTILNHTFSHTLDLTVPEELFEIVWKDISSKLDNIQYSRVILPLSALLQGDFFNVYIKSGNVLMISEGRPGVDDIYSLANGILKLELSKESYERAGLVGKAIRDGARKHVKTRYAIEVNLRLPSMLHGKKGFQRIVWAFKNVLNSAVTWLFHDLEKSTNSPDDGTVVPAQFGGCGGMFQAWKSNGPYRTFASANPEASSDPEDLCPTGHLEDFEDYAVDTSEWLGLLALDSPRVQAGNSIDPYLCRYEIPSSQQPQGTNLVRIRWRGLLPVGWITRLLLECIYTTRKSWFAVSVSGFKLDPLGCHNGYTILRLPERRSSKPIDNESPNIESRKEEDIIGDYEHHGQYVVWDHVGAFEGCV